MLLKIIQEVSSDLDDIKIECAICVAFARFLRCGEFTWSSWEPQTSSQHLLSRKHVEYHTNGSVTLALPASKTDPYRIGTAIQLALTKLFHAQPKAATNHYFQDLLVDPSTGNFSSTKSRNYPSRPASAPLDSLVNPSARERQYPRRPMAFQPQPLTPQASRFPGLADSNSQNLLPCTNSLPRSSTHSLCCPTAPQASLLQPQAAPGM